MFPDKFFIMASVDNDKGSITAYDKDWLYTVRIIFGLEDKGYDRLPIDFALQISTPVSQLHEYNLRGVFTISQQALSDIKNGKVEDTIVALLFAVSKRLVDNRKALELGLYPQEDYGFFKTREFKDLSIHLDRVLPVYSAFIG